MRAYLFRLQTDAANKDFQGIVVILATAPQQIWRQFLTDEAAEHITHSVNWNEINLLNKELADLTPGEYVGDRARVLGILFDDALVVGSCRAKYIGWRDFEPNSVRHSQRVNGWYTEERLEFGHIFADSTARFNRGAIFAGDASTTVWSGVFAEMSERLSARGASPQECLLFQDAIERAIAAAAESELTEEERTALHNALSAAFGATIRRLPPALAPKAGFLRHVRFS